MIKNPVASSFILLLTAGFLIGGGLLLNHREDRYYSLLADEGSSVEIKDYLIGEGISHLATAEDPVVYSDFTSMVKIPLKDLSARFLSSDRRYDPYLKELTDLFITSRGERIFFRSDRSLLSLFRLLAPVRGQAAWEQSVPPAALAAIPFFYCTLLLLNLYRYGSGSFRPLLVQILWLPYYFIDPGYHMVFLPLAILWELLILDYWGQWGRVAILSCLVTAFGAMLSSGTGLFLFFLLLILSLSIGLLIRPRSYPEPPMERKTRPIRLFRKKTEHSLFRPVYFEKSYSGKKKQAFPGVRKGALLSVLILALPLFLFSPGKATKTSYVIPGSGDFYNHIYYQENILYSLAWGSRDPVFLTDYSWDRNTGEILVHKENIASFTPEWMENIRETYGTGQADSFLLDLPAGTKFLPIIFSLDFNKNSIFVIIALFFLSELVMSQVNYSGKEKKSLQIIKRGREVA